jgi:hypothetical protein
MLYVEIPKNLDLDRVGRLLVAAFGFKVRQLPSDIASQVLSAKKLYEIIKPFNVIGYNDTTPFVREEVAKDMTKDVLDFLMDGWEQTDARDGNVGVALAFTNFTYPSS